MTGNVPDDRKPTIIAALAGGWVADAATPEAPDPENLSKARAGSNLDAVGTGDTFGRTCYLHEAMPVIFHILSHAGSYTEAVRANIQCGGDSCGRSWVIGPAMAETSAFPGSDFSSSRKKRVSKEKRA